MSLTRSVMYFELDDLFSEVTALASAGPKAVGKTETTDQRMSRSAVGTAARGGAGIAVE